MNKNILIALGGATLIALVVAMLMSALLKGGRDKEVVEAEPIAPPVQILVAAAPIKTGELLTDKNLQWKTWPQDAAFPGTIQRSEKQTPTEGLSGRAIRPIALDEPLMRSAVISDEGGFMAAMLTPGKRAVAVKVNAETMAGGFINPGDYVDILMTYRSTIKVGAQDPILKNQMERVVERNLDRYATETILQNIRILGVDQRATKAEEKEDGKEKGIKVAKTVTIEVDDRQAEILALASQMGDLSLALRSLGDDTIVENRPPTITDARLTKIYDEVEAELSKMGGGGQGYVRVYNGGQVSNLPAR